MKSVESYVNFRGRSAALVHPPDRDREQLTRHLSRIGLQTREVWPVSEGVALVEDFVFLSTEVPNRIWDEILRKVDAEGRIGVGIVENETPTTIGRALRSQVDALIVKPFRATGLLSLIAHAALNKAIKRSLEKKNDALTRKLEGFRRVERAKEILMAQKALSGDEAFALLRKFSMNERRSVEDVASRIIDAVKLFEATAAHNR